MTSKGKELYHTIKRSLTSPPFGAGTSSSTVASNGARYSGGSTGSKQWIHPPDILINGRVEYSLKLLGMTEVSEPKGTHVIRDAIHAIRFQLQVNKGITGHSGSKLKKVDIHINVDGLTVIDNKTKMILHKYPLHRISFCADDKQDKRVFSFIAKEDSSTRHKCFVFLSEKLAEQITLTVGEAFDLAYQKFIEKNGRDLENRKQVIVLRKRIAELESENNELKEKLAAALRQNSINYDQRTPSLPTSPVPSQPPSFLATLAGPASSAISSASVPVLQPPPVAAKRSHPCTSPTNMAIMEDLSNNGPDVGKKLENLRLDKFEDIFDNEFDPRADERKKAQQSKVKDQFGLDPFGDAILDEVLKMESNGNDHADNAELTGQEPTPEQFEQMLSIVDKRLAEMLDGFATGHLAVGDTGDSARDLQSIYSIPSNQSLETASPPSSSANLKPDTRSSSTSS